MPKTLMPRGTVGERPVDGHSTDPVRSAVRHLISQAKAAGSPAPTSHPTFFGRPVLLDVEVDGVRCILVGTPDPVDDGPVLLSPREQEIARMVAKGYPNKTIAAVLDISAWTVGTYIRRIFAKLRVGSRAAMVSRLHDLNPMEARR
jgi:DNA-binding CsgD family transcriptional regulator